RDALCTEASRLLSKEGLKRAHLLAPALSRIFKDYDRHLSIDELAELCSVSKYYFCRLFKEEMGVTAVEYITNHRISLAEALLREGKKSMEEIAYLCGFEDISYFYRCYKKVKGVSPKKNLS
ncbi:MAG: helix-turn-helix transcriptional regulator, partial [Ruminococcaceae bacterium]|nr:helix-turn-helix transcriptional regulator [Oscillospiraceae bacterium]